MELADDPIDINIGLSQRDAGYAATRYLFDLGHRRIATSPRPLDAARRGGASTAICEAIEAGRHRHASAMIATDARPSSVTLGAELFGELLARGAGHRRASSAATTTSPSAASSNASAAAFACPTTSRSSASTTSNSAPAPIPSLSSVATPRYEMARRAAEIVLEIIRGSGERPRDRRIDLGFRIVERESTAPSRRLRRVGRMPAETVASGRDRPLPRRTGHRLDRAPAGHRLRCPPEESLAFKFRQLQYFVAVAETGSISGAARQLSVSQSAVTEAVKELESDLGATLLDRSGRGVALTHKGQLFLRHAGRILETVADARRSFADDDGAVPASCISAPRRWSPATSSPTSSPASAAPFPRWRSPRSRTSASISSTSSSMANSTWR